MREALANLLVGDFRALEDVTGDPRVDRVEVAGVDPALFLEVLGQKRSACGFHRVVP